MGFADQSDGGSEASISYVRRPLRSRGLNQHPSLNVNTPIEEEDTEDEASSIHSQTDSISLDQDLNFDVVSSAPARAEVTSKSVSELIDDFSTKVELVHSNSSALSAVDGETESDKATIVRLKAELEEAKKEIEYLRSVIQSMNTIAGWIKRQDDEVNPKTTSVDVEKKP